jgi:serine/threonine-protein kinase
MARVYVARDTQTGEDVAVKILTPMRGKRRLLALMQREAEALERLDHPNIVKTLAHGPTDNGGFFIAMELIEGPSITDFIRQNDTEPEDAIRLVLQVCSALRHAHRKGMIHRDLKSSNLLVARDHRRRARVKLIDFGIVKITDQDTLSGNRPMLGSVHTVSPEQVKSEPVDHRADLYSLGVLMYRLIAGKYPFHSRIAAETLTQHVHAEIPVLEDPLLPPDIPGIVAKCMAKNPDDRFQSAQELMDALSSALEVPTSAFTRPLLPTGGPATLSPTPLPSANTPNRTGLAMTAGVVVIAAIVLLWVFAAG